MTTHPAAASANDAPADASGSPRTVRRLSDEVDPVHVAVHGRDLGPARPHADLQEDQSAVRPPDRLEVEAAGIQPERPDVGQRRVSSRLVVAIRRKSTRLLPTAPRRPPTPPTLGSSVLTALPRRTAAAIAEIPKTIADTQTIVLNALLELKMKVTGQVSPR